MTRRFAGQEPVVFVSSDDVPDLVADLTRDGVRVLQLDGSGVTSRTTFLRELVRSIPLDPPLQSARSWDAIADSIFGGLAEPERQEVVVIWTDAAVLERAAREEYRTAVEVFGTVAGQLAVNPPVGSATTLTTVVVHPRS